MRHPIQELKIRRIEFRDKLYRRRYLLPNLVTLANMFAGFLSIIYAASGRFEKCALAMGIAILLDGLDGRVARKFNATSKFGLELDSLADVVSFGIAPALAMYHWCFRIQADEFGVAVSFIYALCAASRLARFNISAESLVAFSGLPTPGAGGVVAALIFARPSLEQGPVYTALGAVLMISLALLMVSKLEFLSVKKLRISHVPLSALIGSGSLMALIWYYPRIGFLCLAFSYAYSGPVAYLYRRYRGQASAEDKRAA